MVNSRIQILDLFSVIRCHFAAQVCIWHPKPSQAYKRIISLRGRAVIALSFRNSSAQLRNTCSRGVSCAGLSQHAAYVLTRLCRVRGDCNRCTGRRAASRKHRWSFRDLLFRVRRATKTLSCCWPFIISSCILHHTCIHVDSVLSPFIIIHIHMYVYIYVYVYICVCVCVCVFIVYVQCFKTD